MAIDSASRNHPRMWSARRWPGRTPLVSLGVGALLGLSALGGLTGCSKGGAPDLMGCAKLADLMIGDSVVPPANSTYAILKSSSGAMIPVPLDGTKGSYSGTHLFSQCDQQDTYTVTKVVLLNKNNTLVATAISPGSGSYTVSYPDGRTTQSPSFPNNATYAYDMNTPAVTLQSLTLSAATANQGEQITVTAAMSGGELCGIRDSQWWLTSNLTGSSMITTPQIIPGGSGSVTIRVPPTVMPSTYYLAGQVTLSGRTLQIRQVTVNDMNYTIVDTNGKTYPTVAPKVPVVSVMVTAKPDVDKMAPQVVSIEAAPTTVVRCGTVNLTLHLKDDQPPPAGQQVKVWLGPAPNARLFSTMLVGNEYLSGKVQLPVDAPSGVWYAWPEVIHDAAGNEARASFTADGKFTLNPAPTDPMAQSIAAAKFTVASSGTEPPDMSGPAPDLATIVDLGGLTDMATPLPAVLTNISITTMAGQSITVYATWTDNTGTL